MRGQPANRVAAFTLAEVVAAMAIMAILSVAIGSTLMIASRAVDDGTAAGSQTPSARDAGDIIMSDLADALSFSERTANAVTFTVPDRDGDDEVEKIRYSWNGAPGGLLVRTINDSAATIATDVHNFDLSYLTRTVKPPDQACCYIDGSCVDEAPDDCSSNGGMPKGKYTTCAEESCIGACCGRAGECNDLSEPACEQMDDTVYHGDGSSCADVECPVMTVLFVVANPNLLTDQEVARKSLLLSWHYTLKYISDDNLAADSADAVDADVIYLSEQANDSVMDGTFASTTAGVVLEEAGLFDEAGFSAFASTSYAVAVQIRDNTHYITSPFSTGTLTILTDYLPIMILLNNEASGLQHLASSAYSTSEEVLATLDAGATLSGGGAAAGRRVKLPWGGTGFDFTLLNDNGKTLFQRSFEWAAGIDDGTKSSCGDGLCSSIESPCNCFSDCGVKVAAESPGTYCADGIDNDCDGHADCDDADCASDAACVTVCGNGTCESGESPCSCGVDCGAPIATESNCSDGIDNNCNGATDCDDANCKFKLGCIIMITK
ncbi:MAG: type II secretion system protein [Phycisphaerales bacterium]|nr:type II secretion system protein [Phycisphaerales bacterium]